MAVVSVYVDEATVQTLDNIAKAWRVETGQNVTRSDVVKEAITELIRSQPQ